MTATDKAPSRISKSRLEFLFDGVFAIAMTLLVLELKVPELVSRNSVHELAGGLLHHAPTFVSYLLTFLMLGVFWYRHNVQYRYFRVITGSMLILHLIQLAAAAFFPFCAALLGRYPTNGLSAAVYTGCILAYSWASALGWIVARRSDAFSPEVTTAEFLRIRNRGIRGCIALSAIFGLYLARILG